MLLALGLITGCGTKKKIITKVSGSGRNAFIATYYNNEEEIKTETIGSGIENLKSYTIEIPSNTTKIVFNLKTTNAGHYLRLHEIEISN